MDFLSWQELTHDRFDIEDGRPIDCIQSLDVKFSPITLQNLDDGRPEPVGAVLPPLTENSDSGPVGIIPWVPCAGFDLFAWHKMEQKEYLGV